METREETSKEVCDIAGMPFDKLVDRAEEIVARNKFLFQKAGELISIVKSRNGMTGFHPVHSSFIRYALSREIDWMDGEKKIHPPSSIAKCLQVKSDWKHIRHLRTVVPFPVMDGAGNICVDEGYNAATEVYFSGGVKVNVKDHPTKEDAQEAIADLLDIVCDFPFADESHKSTWVAALLSPLSRFMHQGNFPICVIQANQARTGKTRLAKVISLILSGTDIACINHSENAEEERKKMWGFMRLGRCIGLIDNVVGSYGGPVINVIATSRFVEDRVLGSSRVSGTANDTFWLITGNNIILQADTSERSINVRLSCEDERPNLRGGWKHPDLFVYVAANREKFLSHALTILKAYVVAGKPKQDIKPFGSFEEWNDLVAGALVWAGMRNPTDSREELERDSDTNRQTSITLVEGWLSLQAALGKFDGMRAKEAKAALDSDNKAAIELREALFEMTQAKATSVQQISRQLREVKDRNFGGKILRIVQHDDKNGNIWSVTSLKDNATVNSA